MKQFPTEWEDFKDSKLCNAWVATAIIGASVVGAGASIYSANKAAGAQTQAADAAAAVNQNAVNNAQTVYNTTRSDLLPYNVAGQAAEGNILSNPAFSTIDQFTPTTAPFAPPTDEASLEATPGYQFTKTQGLKAVANSAAARGLGVSGAALKGAAAFTTGLADNTYQQNYDRALNTYNTQYGTDVTNFNTNLQSKSNAYNRLKGLVDTGESAGAGTGNVGAGTASTVGSSSSAIGGNIIGGGNAQAAASNATGSAISGGANNIGGYLAYQGLYGGNNPSYGGGSPFTGDAYGGSRSQPLPGLTSADYGG